MIKLLICVFLVFLTTQCNAQGSWNIGYLEVDSISEAHVGKTVRLDFKSVNGWTGLKGPRHIRSYIETKDTASVTIDGTLYLLAERRKIYVDHGSYSDQYLECINCSQRTLFIYDAKIINVDTHFIQFQLDLEIKRAGQSTIKEPQIIRIDKSNLDGVMYRL